MLIGAEPTAEYCPDLELVTDVIGVARERRARSRSAGFREPQTPQPTGVATMPYYAQSHAIYHAEATPAHCVSDGNVAARATSFDERRCVDDYP